VLGWRLLRGFAGDAQVIFPGVYLTRLINKVIANNAPFDFDTALAINAAYASWDIGDPTKIVIAKAGWFWVGGDFTTLGTAYGGANNSDWIAQIERNGSDLDHAIMFERHDHSSGATADGMSIGGPRLLDVDDEISVLFQNANAANLLVESNPSEPPAVGSDYTTQPGTGAMSPHLYVYYVGDAPP